MCKSSLIFICLLTFSSFAIAQEKKYGTITGNLQSEIQTYQKDANIGADSITEKIRSNSYLNLNYFNRNFSAGVRFEAYLDALSGYDSRYDGIGVAHRFARYNANWIDITLGNFYEQFGNGLVLRAYEERGLGYDNAIDGALVRIKPTLGISIKGLIGKQRHYWDRGDGVVRGIDAEITINDFFTKLNDSKNRITLGGSFVSKYQHDKDPLLALPENVGTTAARVNFTHGTFSINSEYAFKGQDPGSDNNYIYKKGQAFLFNTNYATKGMGLMVQYKWVDNMSYRSDRNARLNDLSINHLPAITRNHTYSFAAMYPYATQLKGEAGIQGELFYNFKKGTLLGGKYGTMVSINYSRIHDIDHSPINTTTEIGRRGTDGYKSSFLSMTDSLFNQDYCLEITKRISKKVKGILMWHHTDYNIQALQGHGSEYGGMVHANTLIADIMWQIKPKHALRFESQLLLTGSEQLNDNQGKSVTVKQDYGNWAMMLIEYTVSPHWFVAISDQYNFISNNTKTARNTMQLIHEGKDLHRNHYYSVAGGYTKGASRIQLSYGKQREGILCVGGVCRAVPAAYGFNVSLTTTF